MKCGFCSGDTDDPGHDARCCGRQGHIEAQMPLFASGLTPETYATSFSAAVRVRGKTKAQREQVENEIISGRQLGRTDLEVQRALRIDGSSERPRRIELWKLGRITQLRDADGNVVTRKHNKHDAVVWVSVDWVQRKGPADAGPSGNAA